MTRHHPCARCDWTPDPDLDVPEKLQLAWHSLDSGCPLCPICENSLPRTDGEYGCESCLAEARSLLSGILTMYAELPLHLDRAHGPLPGGDPLVMMAGGSQGFDETGETTRPTDPPSVAFELGWWALGWQDKRGNVPEDQARLLMAGSPSRIVRKAAAYLEVHARWAASHHPGFPEFHADLARLHHRLERATAHDVPVERANADCFDCHNSPLIRGTKTVKVTDEHGRTWEGPVPTDDVKCRDCGQSYDLARYRLALRLAWRSQADGWVVLTTAARLAGRSVETVETWGKRVQISTACRLDDRRKLVLWPDLQQHMQELEVARLERERRRQEQQERKAS